MVCHFLNCANLTIIKGDMTILSGHDDPHPHMWLADGDSLMCYIVMMLRQIT